MNETRRISVASFAVAGALAAILVLLLVAWMLRDESPGADARSATTFPKSAKVDANSTYPAQRVTLPSETPQPQTPATQSAGGAGSGNAGDGAPGGSRQGATSGNGSGDDGHGSGENGTTASGSEGRGGGRPNSVSGGSNGTGGGKSPRVPKGALGAGDGDHGSDAAGNDKQSRPGGLERSHGDNIVYDDRWIQAATRQRRRVELGNRAVEQLRAYIISKLGSESAPSSVNDGESSARALSEDFDSFEVVVTYRGPKKTTRERCAATIHRTVAGIWSVEGDPL